MNRKAVFSSANIMIPKAHVDMTKWSVVACDQYTSEKGYWNGVEGLVGDASSTLNMVFPEIYLEEDGFDERIHSISDSMKNYLSDDIFDIYEDAYIYVKRVLANGKVRHGIMGKVDLECYEYTVGSKTSIRATEGTVLERIPPRVKVRQECPLELPHVMVLIDDEECKVIEGIAEKVGELKQVYGFDLMQESGSITGYLLNGPCIEILEQGIQALMDLDAYQAKYNTETEDMLTFAVGDGNHSLATAKKCYENLKAEIGEKALESKARYALVELVNLHDESLEFEAIHRVMFNVNPEHLLIKLKERFQVQESSELDANAFVMVVQGQRIGFAIENPEANLAVGDLQKFIDGYLQEYGGTVDYIHGEDVVDKLCGEDINAVGFLLNCMDKSELYRTVIVDGVLPRKTFSMGEACDKRFYLEVREII